MILSSRQRWYITLSGWDTQSIKDLFSIEWKLSRENPGAVFYSYNKGDVCGFISSLPLSPRCSPLRYHENTEIHREIPKWTLFPPLLTGSTPTSHWPLSAERRHTESRRPALGTVPGKQVHSEQTRGLDGGQWEGEGRGGGGKSLVWVFREDLPTKPIFELSNKEWGSEPMNQRNGSRKRTPWPRGNRAFMASEHGNGV